MTNIRYTVQVDEKSIKDATSYFEFLGGNSADALRIALNKTAPKARTSASRLIRDELRLSASYVNQRLIVKRATRADLSSSIGAPSRGLILAHYSNNPAIANDAGGLAKPPPVTRGGIRVKVKPSGSAKILTGGPETKGNKPFFIIFGKNKKIGIAARLRNGGGEGRPIKIFQGPSLSQAFSRIRTQMLPNAGKELELQMIDAMRYLLLKKLPPEAV